MNLLLVRSLIPHGIIEWITCVFLGAVATASIIVMVYYFIWSLCELIRHDDDPNPLDLWSFSWRNNKNKNKFLK